MSSSQKKMATFEDLSPEQQRVVSEWGKGLAVMAGAGSGKTTTLVIKCAELLKKNPEAQFAAVSFTEKSASDLRAKLTQRLNVEGKSANESEVLKGHWVTTIHGLCASVLREFPREAGFDGEESMLSEGESQRFWERAIEQLWADQTPLEVEQALEKLLNRESRSTLTDLLRRTRDLYAVGVLDSLRDNGDEASVALAVLSEFVVERYDRLKRRRGALDFNDLERGADRALEHAHVRAAFQKRFQLVLVDEFQDTNPLQAKIILRFVKPDFSNLCVVGDPKQSIYRFRDADVSVFEEFCAKLPIKISLTWNFRSRPGIIEFTNEVCSRAFVASETMPMQYEPLTAKRPESEDFSPVTRLDVRGPNDLALWIQDEVKKGVPLEDMALLLRKIRGNEKWLRALTSAGIQIAVGSGGLFWEDPRVRELVAFLKWWAYPENTYSAAVFFRAPWVGVPDLELDQWFGQSKNQDPREKFFSPEHMASQTTSGALAREFAPLRGKVVRPSELLIRLLVTSEIEDEIGSSLLGLWHRVEDLSSTGLAFHEVVTEISRAVEESRREREVAPPRNEGLLPVLTFHGAKGLEFKHVILIDLAQKTRAHSAPLLYWDRHEGAYLASKDEMGERVKDPIEDAWKAREREKDLAESKRIFYVALTRAEERLILVCPEIFDRKGQPVTFDADEVYSQDFWRGWVECAPRDQVEMLQVPERTSSTTSLIEPYVRPVIQTLDPKVYTPKRPRHSVTEWNTLSRCPRAYEWAYVRPRFSPEALAQKQLVAPADPQDEISQRELGTRVHACLETSDFEGLRQLEIEAGENRFQASNVIGWAENSPIMKADVSFWSELSFEIPVGREILVGSMDRVVQTGEKSFQVVDFKVTRKAKSAEDLLSAYKTQMELYVWALSQISGTENVNSLLVNFSEAGVEEVSVEAQRGSALALKLAESAAEIVEGEVGNPTPNSLCRVCQFRSICPEGQNFAKLSSGI
jgi:ATP-dependent helicase/nuclease subunit A